METITYVIITTSPYTQHRFCRRFNSQKDNTTVKDEYDNADGFNKYLANFCNTILEPCLFDNVTPNLQILLKLFKKKVQWSMIEET